MGYTFINVSNTVIKVTENGEEILFKKVYCSTAVDGDYFSFMAHELETGRMIQKYTLLYTDCTSPAEASAALLKTAVDLIINAYADGGGTVTSYYGQFLDNLSQSASVINTGTIMLFRTTDLSNGVTVVSNSRITFANTGIYNLNFSVQLQNAHNSEEDVTIWLRKNGTDVVGSAGFVSVPKKTGGVDGHAIVGWNYLLDVVASDYYEIVWITTNLLVTIQFYAAGNPPPSTASTLAIVTQQSGIMAGTGITAINSLTGAAQTLVVGSSGTDFAINSAGTAHTFNIPTASATNRGLLSTADWSTFNGKQAALGFTPVPNSRTITINGVTQDLTANRTYTVATETVNKIMAYIASY